MPETPFGEEELQDSLEAALAAAGLARDPDAFTESTRGIPSLGTASAALEPGRAPRPLPATFLADGEMIVGGPGSNREER